MAFCEACGQSLSNNAKFCPACGKSVDQSFVSETVKSDIERTRTNCPNCGAALGALAIRCPACGYERRNTGSSQSLKDFADCLRNSNDPNQQARIIASFPVPNNKEDIFEFVNLAASNLDVSRFADDISESDPQKAIAKAWYAKLSQVHTKALALFDASDDHLAKITSIHESIQNKINQVEKSNYRKNNANNALTLSGTIIALVIIIFGLVMGSLGDYSMDSSRANLLLLIGGIVLVISAAMSGKGDRGIIGAIGSTIGCVLALAVSVIYPMIDKSWSMVSSRSNAVMLFAVIALIIAVVRMLKASRKKMTRKSS